MTPIIEIENYSFTTDNVEILHSVSLNIEKGDYYSIIGPNGAGKSTLLKCLMRINKGGKGLIKIDGKELGDINQRNLAGIISYIPQNFPPDIPCSVEEFVLMSRYPYMGLFTAIRAKDIDIVKKSLEITGILKFSERKISSLSGGERQTVAVAAALAQSGKIMLLDEPAAFLDPKHEIELLVLLRRINEEYGTTVITVTHNINHAAFYGDTVGIMKDGRFIFSGKPVEMMKNSVLAPVYGRNFEFIAHPRNGLPVIIPEGRLQ